MEEDQNRWKLIPRSEKKIQREREREREREMQKDQETEGGGRTTR
jgi:hypothetical protein